MIYEIEELCFSYDARFSLKIPHLEIPREGITGIVGPSGSGKSTLLMNLAFLQKGSWKSFKFCGKEVKPEDLKSLRRIVTYVSQHPILFSTTIKENLSYPLKLRRIPKDVVEKSVYKISRLLQIEHVLNSRPWEISGGEAQRVCIGRALIFKPKVVLLDEPTSNLDEENESIIEKILRDISTDTKLIIVSHNKHQIRRLCDTHFVMKNGMLLQNIQR